MSKHPENTPNLDKSSPPTQKLGMTDTKRVRAITCQECGYICQGAEYHPYWHCVLAKAGQLDIAKAVITQLLDKRERESRLDEGSQVWKAIVPIMTNLPDELYLAVKDAIYNRKAELQAAQEGAQSE